MARTSFSRRLGWLTLMILGVAACGPEAAGGGAEAVMDGGADSASPSAPDPAPVAPPRKHRVHEGPVPDTVTIETEAFVVAPGEELFRCQNFDNPFGADVDVVQSEHRMSEGSHHMFVFRAGGAFDDPMTSCSGLEYARYIHASQRSEQTFTYPAGMGRRLPATDGLRVQVHYLNTTADPITTTISVTLHAAPPGTVTTYVGQLFMNTLGVSVAPHSAGSAEKGCAIPSDVSLLSAASHMHRSGVHFLAETDDGRPVYETTDWSEPEPMHYDPPLPIAPGAGIHYRCDYQNDTDRTLTFGESAATNEMCIFSAEYFPAPDGANIDCLF